MGGGGRREWCGVCMVSPCWCWCCLCVELCALCARQGAVVVSHTLSVMERGAAVFVTSACGRQRSGRPCVELLTMPRSQQQVVSGHGCCLLFSQQLCRLSSSSCILLSGLAGVCCVVVIVSAVSHCCCICGLPYLCMLILAAAERLSDHSRAQSQTAEKAK